MKRLNILVSAYACERGLGSEPGIGWGTAWALAKRHRVYVLTREANRSAIEARLASDDCSPCDLTFVYYDLPQWTRFWKKGLRGVQFYYFLWQMMARALVDELVDQYNIDVCHHLTWGRCWMPTALRGTKSRVVVGPVGGVERTPKPLLATLDWRSRGTEWVRGLVADILGRTGVVRCSLASATLVLATSEECRPYLKRSGVRRLEVFTNSGISEAHYTSLSAGVLPNMSSFRILSMGRLLGWKGIHLALLALASLRIPDIEYWIVGDGPRRKALERMNNKLGLSAKVRFVGWVDQNEALAHLLRCHVLLHPSFHDSGGLVCAEAMAAGRPVICLDAGGPAVQVTAQAGFKIAPKTKDQVVADMAEAILRLKTDHDLYTRMREAGQRRARDLVWDTKADYFSQCYEQCQKAEINS